MSPEQRLCQRGDDLAVGECLYLRNLREQQPGMADLTRLGCAGAFQALQNWGEGLREGDCPFAYMAAVNTDALRKGVDVLGIGGAAVSLEQFPPDPATG